MSLAPRREVNAVNTGVPRPKVPIHRKLGLGYPVEERLSENQRVYRDRFELTLRQAQAVQKIMRYLGEDYDPGGEEPTPENLAKRTFYHGMWKFPGPYRPSHARSQHGPEPGHQRQGVPTGPQQHRSGRQAHEPARGSTVVPWTVTR
jgi:hypothetical protein